MPFKKLHPAVKEKLVELEIATPTPIQKATIPAIKSGANVFCIAAKDAGKTTTLILTILNKLKFDEVGMAPRAIVLVENNEKVSSLHDAFFKYTRYSDVRLYACDEKQHVDLLKSEIFEGVDVLIATPKTVKKLLLLEGINTSQLSILSIDDADFLAQKSGTTDILAITQSIYKCQYVLYAEKMHPNLKRLEDYFMQFARTVSV